MQCTVLLSVPAFVHIPSFSSTALMVSIQVYYSNLGLLFLQIWLCGVRLMHVSHFYAVMCCSFFTVHVLFACSVSISGPVEASEVADSKHVQNSCLVFKGLLPTCCCVHHADVLVCVNKQG